MIQGLDHLVITTAQPEACLHFYEALGFCVRDAGGRYELLAEGIQINVHVFGRELLPHARAIRPGSADLCFAVCEPLEHCREVLAAQGIIPLSEIVPRNGRRGPMQSLYFRDPDGNLLELCRYP